MPFIKILRMGYLWWVIMGLLVACTPSPPKVTQEMYVFGTRLEMLAYPNAQVSEAALKQAMQNMAVTLDTWHHAWHAWEGSGELFALNQAIAQGLDYEVTPALKQLLLDLQSYEAASNAYFSPAIGRMVQAWGFERSDEHYQRIKPELQASLAAEAPRMADLRFDGLKVRSVNPAVWIDFSGILKGYALDYFSTQLRALGVTQALLNFGGNVMAIGQKPDGQAWQVGIQHPRKAQPMGIVALYDGDVLGSSGDYQRFFEIDGQRYCHLINPYTASASCDKALVTVLVRAQAHAGAWSEVATKALFFTPANQAASRISHLTSKAHTIEYLIIGVDHQLHGSPGFEAILRWEEAPVDGRIVW
jgi:thiamine biosynthesis lipoprotein